MTVLDTRDETREVLRQVRRIEIATRRAVTDQLAGRYHSVFKGQGMAFSEVRPYLPGDDIRHIDWNVSARHADHGLFVKQFIEEREMTVTLLVDLSASGAFATQGESKRRRIARAAALLAFSATSNDDRVGLILFTDEVELYLPPRKGRGHVLRLIREVLEAKPRRRGTRIAEALAFLGRVQRRRSVVFVLSDWLDRDFEKPLAQTLARHDVVAIRVHDPAERVLPNLGLVQLVDAETGRSRRVDSSSASVREAYRKAQLSASQSIRKRLLETGCDLIDLSTDEDILVPMVNFFRRRETHMRSGR